MIIKVIQFERMFTYLDQISDVHWHFVNLRGIILLDITQNPNVIALYEVNRDTLSAETSRTTYPVDV